MKLIALYLLVFSLFVSLGCKRPPGTDQKIMDPISVDTTTGKVGGDVPEIKIDDSKPDSEAVHDPFGQLQPVFFDYDKAEIRNDQISVLQSNAQFLGKSAVAYVEIQGHCDERGTEEYNLALGDRRARIVKEYLSNLGISPNRLSTISYGETRPFERNHDEDAWRQNRRAQFQGEERTD